MKSVRKRSIIVFKGYENINRVYVLIEYLSGITDLDSEMYL